MPGGHGTAPPWPLHRVEELHRGAVEHLRWHPDLAGVPDGGEAGQPVAVVQEALEVAELGDVEKLSVAEAVRVVVVFGDDAHAVRAVGVNENLLHCHAAPLVPARLAQRLAVFEERAQLVVKQGQRCGDSHVHVQVLVGAQAPAEQDVVLL